MSYIHVSDDDVAATSGCDIAATIEENTIRIVDKDGNVVEEGVLGIDDTACLQAGIEKKKKEKAAPAKSKKTTTKSK